MRPWREGAEKVRVLGSGLKTKREEENEGSEASFRVCKVVPPTPMVFVSVQGWTGLWVLRRERKSYFQPIYPPNFVLLLLLFFEKKI